MKKKVVVTLLSLHILVFLVGTSLFDFSAVPVLLQGPVIYYLSLTGGHPYNFFSPDIPAQIIVKCMVTDQHNDIRTETFSKATNTYELRSNYLFQMLDNDGDVETAGQIAAGFCFHRYVGARSVRVVISRYVVPSIDDFKNGKQCDLIELYSHTYTYE